MAARVGNVGSDDYLCGRMAEFDKAFPAKTRINQEGVEVLLHGILEARRDTAGPNRDARQPAERPVNEGDVSVAPPVPDCLHVAQEIAFAFAKNHIRLKIVQRPDEALVPRQHAPAEPNESRGEFLAIDAAQVRSAAHFAVWDIFAEKKTQPQSGNGGEFLKQPETVARADTLKNSQAHGQAGEITRGVMVCWLFCH